MYKCLIIENIYIFVRAIAAARIHADFTLSMRYVNVASVSNESIVLLFDQAYTSSHNAEVRNGFLLFSEKKNEINNGDVVILEPF